MKPKLIPTQPKHHVRLHALAIDSGNGRPQFAFDFSLYEWPPSFVRADKPYVRMRIEWAQVSHDILYVAHSHSTYARSSNGFNLRTSSVTGSAAC